MEIKRNDLIIVQFYFKYKQTQKPTSIEITLLHPRHRHPSPFTLPLSFTRQKQYPFTSFTILSIFKCTHLRDQKQPSTERYLKSDALWNFSERKDSRHGAHTGPWRVDAGSFVIEVAQLVLLRIFCHLLVGPTPTSCIDVNNNVPTNILRPFLITASFVCLLRNVNTNKPTSFYLLLIMCHHHYKHNYESDDMKLKSAINT